MFMTQYLSVLMSGKKCIFLLIQEPWIILELNIATENNPRNFKKSSVEFAATYFQTNIKIILHHTTMSAYLNLHQVLNIRKQQHGT